MIDWITKMNDDDGLYDNNDDDNWLYDDDDGDERWLIELQQCEVAPSLKLSMKPSSLSSIQPSLITVKAS